NGRRAIRYARGVPPATPRSVAIVAVATVSAIDARSSASLMRLERPLSPAADTSPTTGARMNSKNTEAASATTTVATARAATVGARRGPGGGAGSVRTNSAPGSDIELGGRAGADHHRMVEQVDVRCAESAARIRREQEREEATGNLRMRRMRGNREGVENPVAEIDVRRQCHEAKSVRLGDGLI